MPKYSKIEPYDWLLGQCYDRIVAYLAGTTTNAVQIRRANKGIPPYADDKTISKPYDCLLYTSPSPRDKRQSRMPSSA